MSAQAKGRVDEAIFVATHLEPTKLPNPIEDAFDDGYFLGAFMGALGGFAVSLILVTIVRFFPTF